MLSTYVNVWPDQANAPMTVNRDYIPLMVALGLLYFDYKHTKSYMLRGHQSVTALVIQKFVAAWERAP